MPYLYIFCILILNSSSIHQLKNEQRNQDKMEVYMLFILTYNFNLNLNNV